ncbi:MAG: benzoyl-CoA reductase subunit A [Deltaproteobacteria bacterium]|nr:benzoyl-CoA reductase subunit A [Deltaproteobacteria bacterium]
MKGFVGIDLGSTTTKAIIADADGIVLGRGITNSRSNYQHAAAISTEEARIEARFAMLRRALLQAGGANELHEKLFVALQHRFRLEQNIAQLDRLAELAVAETHAATFHAHNGRFTTRVAEIFSEMRRRALSPLAPARPSEFFRDDAISQFSTLAIAGADAAISFETLMGIFDKAIVAIEGERLDLTFEGHIHRSIEAVANSFGRNAAAELSRAAEAALAEPLEINATICTGYGRQRLPFPKEQIRSEILCHGQGAHALFPDTRTVLDIGGQDTKAIQVDENGIVTSFQMNDRCAAGCGRYLGYIADEMSLGIHELGPLADTSTRRVKITSTCTVFAGAELRDRLTLGQKREDILAGMHRAMVLRSMALLARSGGIRNEFTFTGGVAKNVAAVRALRALVAENYGERTINISPDSIYTGALGAALFAVRT